MEINIARLLEILAVIILSSYFPMLTFSFFKYRLVKKQEELMLLMERVNLLSSTNSGSLKAHFDKEYAPGDYIMPVFFISMLTFIGTFLLLLTWMVYDFEDSFYASILFSGASFWMDSTELVIEKRSVAVIAFSIMGSYISASGYIYRRFSTIDLTPGNYFSVGLRTIMAALVSLMISFAFSDTELVKGNMILVVAFLIGLFPDTGLKMLLERVKIFPLNTESVHKSYPLDRIEGINEMHKIRLNEAGIDNVQNLAQYNFLMLIIKTPFPVRTLLDWIVQAKLIVEFREDYWALQKAGIRTALDFLDACDDKPQRFDQIAETCNVNKLALEVNFQNLKNDQSVTLLNHFRNNLEQFHRTE